MRQYHEKWQRKIIDALSSMGGNGVDGDSLGQIVGAETPPDDVKGDIAFPMFPLARELRQSPKAIAERVADLIVAETGEQIVADGPYVNVFVNRRAVVNEVLSGVSLAGDRFGSNEQMQDQRIMVEFSAPNTNKPLHLGHLRNDALGESIARILEFSGAHVRRVNLINDRGIHICKSMAAYQRFGNGETPESAGRKPDHFVGDFYVKYAEWEKSDESAEVQARDLLQKWEQGEPAVVALWKEMNGWAIRGVKDTYARTGIRFDKIYFESDTYTLGRGEIMKGLKAGVFTKDENGTIWVDLTDIGLDRKVLLRADGTSLYLTQDIGTAIERQREWPFDRLIYVVANEQRYHFQVLFEVLRRLGMGWADNLFHLAYGMVNLPEGKMKSREGTVVDADDLLDELSTMAAGEIRAKGRVEESLVAETAEHVALAALHYYLLQTNPMKDMIFDPAESLSFSGNTGPYLQYVGARVTSMLRKISWDKPGELAAPSVPDEWALTKCIARFPEVCEDAARQKNPALIAGFLYETAKTFSRFYHDHPIAVADDPAVRDLRMALATSVSVVMRNGLHLLNIPFVEAM